MKIRILGSAAGGGFPQWNCGCPNCRGFRAGTLRARARTQSQVAITSDHRNWHLLNASPDLRQQILNHADLQPDGSSLRDSPIRSVMFTNADIDHTAGALLLRESQPLRLHATSSVQRLLREGNAYFGMLEQFDGQSDWRVAREGERFEFAGLGDSHPSRMLCTPYALVGSPPYWAKVRNFEGTSEPAVIGALIDHGGHRVGYFPGVGVIDDRLLETLASCDLVLFDGTFWDDEELVRLRPGARTALQMQHVPMSGESGSIARLAQLPARVRRVFLHINNTNPVLNESGPEHAFLREAGWTLSHDGMEFEL